VIDRRPALALDGLSIGVHLLDDKQLLIERIDNGGVDGREADLAELAAVFEDVPAHHPEAHFVVALRSGV
jgi:hypothetical protein